MSDSDSGTFDIDAHPVKEFFIEIITRDVKLIDTIPEFVDNSIDGATRIADDEEDLSGLYVRIDADSDEITIKDNCGGIPRDLAEDYAFRFGRPDMEGGDLPSKIGKFGVGMKRSFFRLGKNFLLETYYHGNNERYVIEIDSEEWKQHDGWNFTGESIDEDDPRCTLDETGTRIQITDLHESPRENFGDNLFISKLRSHLTSEFSMFLNRSLEIILNNEGLGYSPLEMLEDDDFKPAFQNFIFEREEEEVEVDIRAGLGEADPNKAGWYVFCNGRLVLEADQSEMTGWGDPLPKYHNDFARFRGMVNFKSSDPGALPWNTTKTDINPDSGVYQRGKQRMISVTRSVFNFLREVSNQKSDMNLGQGESSPIEQRIDSGEYVDVNQMDTSEERDFTAPNPEEVEEEDEVGYINYSRPKDKIEDIKDVLGVGTYKEVGVETFEYFYSDQVER
ncbi:ATP-binding protein [Haloarchaeobius amylolyticus]|uniref:ATP-binding protein n=1 Tax=Haloarchaeobius amylolyticus TaxID=1198296 RepID=UPI00226FE479|nr:ATP-binding protein [Haloarchaeobius amylolyticus]